MPSTIADTYTLVRADFDHVHPPEEPPWLPRGYRFDTTLPRSDERSLLQEGFPEWLPPAQVYEWEIAYRRRLAGLRGNSVIAIHHRDRGIAVSFVVDENETGTPGYGQGHYLCVHPDHRGRDLFRALWLESLRRVHGWGMRGMFACTDRVGHPRVYERWGACVASVRARDGHHNPG